jgi:hypothetical protein
MTAAGPKRGGDDGDSEIEIDRHAPAISEALTRDGKIYRKTGEVQAEQASAATLVETVLADGTKETKNMAAPGDFIVTAPAGERYVVKPDTFLARYVPKRGKTGLYTACGQIVAVPNPLGRPISIMASWGEAQHGSANCMIADVFDPATKQRKGQPYLIALAEFKKTYKPVRPPRNKK